MRADLGQTVDIGLAGTVVATLNRVIEKPIDAVAIILVVLGCVDAALGRDGMGAARGVLQAEGEDVVAQLGQRGRGRSAGQPGTDDDQGVVALVRRIDQLEFELVFIPLLRDRTARDISI